MGITPTTVPSIHAKTPIAGIFLKPFAVLQYVEAVTQYFLWTETLSIVDREVSIDS